MYIIYVLRGVNSETPVKAGGQLGVRSLKCGLIDPQSHIVIFSENSHVGARNSNRFDGELCVEEANGGEGGGIPNGHVLVFYG